MNLSVNLISGGRYYRAWDDIPDADLPAFARKFAVPEGDGKQAPAPAAPAVAHRLASWQTSWQHLLMQYKNINGQARYQIQ